MRKFLDVYINEHLAPRQIQIKKKFAEGWLLWEEYGDDRDKVREALAGQN